MKHLLLAATIILMMTSAHAQTTPSGILLDTAWKKTIFSFSQKNVVHPAWGLAHSERDYQVTRYLLAKEGVSADLDVLFAAAFLHDLGGIAGFEKPKVDHAVRSAELAEPLLREAGFPMEKWPAVRSMILGHLYYGPAPASRSDQAFRDADILDFLGAIGIARLFAITQEPGRTQTTLAPIVGQVGKFYETLPAQLSLPSARSEAALRLPEMKAFFQAFGRETLNRKAM